MPESKEVAGLALRFAMIAGEVNVVDAVDRTSFNSTTFDWYVGHLARKRLGEVVISEPIFAGGCFWRIHFYPQGIVSQDFTSLYIESVDASKDDCPESFKAFLTVKIFIDPEIYSKPKTSKVSSGPANDDIGDSASQVGSEGGSENGSQVSARSGSAAGSRASKAGSSLSKTSRMKSQASSAAASSSAASKHNSQLSAKGGGSKTEQEIMNVQSWITDKPWKSMASSYSRSKPKLGFAEFFDKSVFFNKKAGMMMYVRGDKKLETSYLDGVAKLRFSLTAVCDFDHSIVEDPDIDEYGRQKTKWVVRNFWGLQKQLPWGEKITSEEFTSGQRFCFQMFPNGYCSNADQALKLQSDAANDMLSSAAMAASPAELKPVREMCMKIKNGIQPPDQVKTTTYQDTTGSFGSSTGYLSMFLHYGEDPISRNTVSKAVFQLGIVLQKKDPTGFFCPDRDLMPGGVYWVGSDLKTSNPATGEAEKGCLYYPQPPPGHVLYPSRKTYGKQKFIELEKLHNCTFVSGDFQNGGDITFVLNMLVTQREVQNFRSLVRDVNIAGNDAFPVANKRAELIVSKRPKMRCEECEAPLEVPIQYCSCCGAARCPSCMTSVCRIPGYGFEDYSWKQLRVYARPADPGMVSKVLQKSSGLIGSAADRVSASGSSLTSSLFSYAQAVGERVKSLLPVVAAAVESVESEQDAANRLAAASTADAGADLIRQAAAEQRAKDAAEQRIKAAKGMEENDLDDTAKNPLLKAIPALKPQLKPKQLPDEVQKRPNDPSQRQPCRVYPWLFLWKEYSDREVSSDGSDIKHIHVRRPFSSAEALLKKRDPSLPLMSSHLDKEIGWITHAERAHFEDALFSQPVGRCCEGRLSAEREALQKLIQKTQLDLRNKANVSVESDGSVTQRSTASNASAMASAAADDAAEAEQDQDEGDDSEIIAMLPSYEISKSGVISWTYMDKMSGNLDKLKMIRKHDRPDDLKSYLPARHMCVGVLARGQLQEPLVHDHVCCSTVLEGDKVVVDPVSKQQKTEKYKYMCKEAITPKNASTCASCGKNFCNKPTCIFPGVELQEFEAPEGNGPKDKKAVVLSGPVCASCKSAREDAKGAWIVKAPKPEEEPEKPGFLAPLLAIFSPPPLTEEQMEREKERQEKADEKFQDKKYKFLGKISFGLIKRPEED